MAELGFILFLISISFLTLVASFMALAVYIGDIHEDMGKTYKLLENFTKLNQMGYLISDKHILSNR